MTPALILAGDSFAPAHSARDGPSLTANSFCHFPKTKEPHRSRCLWFMNVTDLSSVRWEMGMPGGTPALRGEN